MSDDANVVKLGTPQRVQVQFEPNADVIRHCRNLLELAESGKLQAIAYAMVEHDGLTPAAVINAGFYNAGGTTFGLDAAISRLRRRWDDELATP